MNWLDLLILCPLIYGLIVGLKRGIVREVFTIVGLVVGVLLSRWLANPVGDGIATTFGVSMSIGRPIAYFFIFVATMLAFTFLSGMLTKLTKKISLGAMNHLTGALFGIGKWLLIVSIVLNGFVIMNAHTGLVPEDTLAESRLYQPTLKIAGWAWASVKDSIDI